MIKRTLAQILTENLSNERIIIILGARRVGKTTLFKQVFSSYNHLWLNCDEPDIRSLLFNKTSTALKSIIGDRKLVIIDEAQRVKDIGLTLKLIHDNFPEIKLYVTGSSSLELANEIKEPLTGRKWEYELYPLSREELINHHSVLEENRLLEHRLIFGSYPQVVEDPGNAQKILRELADSYLFRDLLMLQDIKKPAQLEKLVQALAFQISSEVSLNELSNMIQIDVHTVARYIDLLEKSFVIFSLPSFSRNLRNEIKKGKKYYFYDLGIRNSLINNWNPINLRNDVGAMWENYLIAERMKYKMYHEIDSLSYFWRTTRQQEIDYIEDTGGMLFAFEFKWQKAHKARIPSTFKNAYPDAKLNIIDQSNMDEFIMMDNSTLGRIG